MTSRFPKFRTAALMTGMGLLMQQELLAQGVSPWLDAINVLQTAFTGPIARGLEPDCHCGGRTDVRIWRRRQQAGFGRDHIWIRHGDGRGQFPDLVVLMQGAKDLAGLSGLERAAHHPWEWSAAGFLLSAMLGLAMWNAINSLVTGGVIFVVLYGAGWLAWREDPNMVEILRASTRFKSRYDPGKWADSPWYFANPRGADECGPRTIRLQRSRGAG